MSLTNRLDRLEAALHQSPGLPTFTVWRREGDMMVCDATSERVPATVWAEEHGEAFTLTIRPQEAHDAP
jgi:hypothetical protein